MTEGTGSEACLPTFLVAGAMRSGTTSWYRYLGAHPEISMMPKELEFFTEHFDEGLDWYQARCREAGRGRLVGEATADYLARESAMQRIATTLPDVKLIITLRDPVERAWSHYGLLSVRGRESRTFSQALDEEMAVLESHGPDAGGVFYLYHGLYDVHLERAHRLFSRRQVHVSIFERMVKNPAGEYRAACEFLGVDTSFEPPRLGEQVNAFVTFRSLRVRKLSHRLPQPLGRMVARVNTRTAAPTPTIPEGVRGRLREFYAPRIERVSDLLGDELAEWRPEA